MLVPLLLVFFPCAFGQLPDPPKITVDSAILKKFGVTEDVNQPGLFQHLMTITPGINSTNPQIRKLAEEARQDVADIHSSILSMSAIHIATGLIDIARPLPEGPLTQFAVAHVLNLYARMSDILDKINDNVIDSLGKFVGSKNSGHQETLCVNIPVVSIAASHFTRDMGAKAACRQFTAMFTKDSSLAQSVLSEAAKAKAALNQVNHLLQDETVPLNRVFDFVRSNGMIPSLYHSLFYQQMLGGYSDYASFYDSIKDSQQVANVIGMPVPTLNSILIQQFTEYLKILELLPQNEIH